MLYQSRRLKIYWELQKLVFTARAEQGFTIIESLMAIVVITLLLVAITPPIFLAVGTRVQNQRAEQAMQLAQRQVDEVRVLIEKGTYTNSDLPPLPATGATDAANTVAAPTSSFTCSTPVTASDACSIDVNGDGRVDFYVQKFRTKEVSAGNPSRVVAFYMGVRVYSAIANGESGLQTTQASLQFTTEQGRQRKYPLAVIYTPVVRGDLKDSLIKYKEFLAPPTSP